MFAGNKFADRLAAKGAEAHQHSEWTLKTTGGIRNLARAVQRRVATVTWPSTSRKSPSRCPTSRSLASTSLEECIRLFAHEIVAGRRAGSVKCKKCLHVCGKKNLRSWLPSACVPWQVKSAPPAPLPPGLPVPGPLVKNDQEEAEPQYEEDERQNDVWQPAFDTREEVEARALPRAWEP